jgi:transposase InsO family protein
MPWKEVTPMSEREELVRQAEEGWVSMSEMCRAYGVSRKTGYKWLRRYREGGLKGLADQSRRPQHSPRRTEPEMEQVIIEARQAHPAWGGRKLKRYLERQGAGAVPQPSTITEILRRHGLLEADETVKQRAYRRFERAKPNELWQMDFKGHFELGSGARCHPLTVLDDHSRFLVGLQACCNETEETVRACLTGLFRAFGLPERMLMDNGAPWGDDPDTPFTALTVWLLRLGIPVSHGRPRHPQTQGKDERFHRTLDDELLSRSTLSDFPACQAAFNHLWQVYNYERPHEALAFDTPAQHYQPSSRLFLEVLPPLLFPAGAAIRCVDPTGRISIHGHRLRVSRAFKNLAVGVLPDQAEDGLFHVFFNDILVRTLDLRLLES